MGVSYEELGNEGVAVELSSREWVEATWWRELDRRKQPDTEPGPRDEGLVPRLPVCR